MTEHQGGMSSKAVVAFYLTREWYKRRNLPPGPFSLPLLGSVGTYGKMAGQPPHVALSQLSKTYGDIFSVWVGPNLMVVLNGFGTIHRAFVTQGLDFADRPNWIAMVKRDMVEGNGVAFSNGEEWHSMRKFSLKSMRDFGGKAGEVEKDILDEIQLLQTDIQQTQGKLTSLSFKIQMAVSNVIGKIIFGKRFEYDDKNLHDLLHGLDLVMKGQGFASPINFLPDFMHPLFPKEHQVEVERNAVMWRTKKLVSGIFEQHEATFDRDNIRDFMDIYIKSSKEDMTQTKNKHFHQGNMWKVIYDMFLAGSETTSTALEWALLFMIEKPEVQQKCQKAISDLVGDRPVQHSDRPSLPYIDAVLNEILRLANIVPLGVPRTNASHDVSIMGYTIPRYAIDLPNIYSAHVDSKYWPEPFKFDPERFLDSDGNLVKKESFIPFSTGPRNCLGDNLARLEIFLIFTNLLQKFNFCRDENAEKHDFSLNTDQYTTLRPRHYILKAVPRA